MDPIRCAEGTAKPHEPFWRMVAAADSMSGEPEMEFDGNVSEYSWMDDDITPKMFKQDLYKIGKNGPITLRVNSGGGDPIAASVIRSILASYPGKKTTIVTGVAASAAVAIVMAGDTVKMMDTAQMMIHEAAFLVFMARLDVPTLEKMTQELKVANASLRDVYSAQTGIPPKEMAKMMAATTWMSANDAVEWGFADEVISGGKVRGNKALLNSLRYYENVPAALLASLEQEEPSADEEQEQEPVEPKDPEAPEGAAEPVSEETATEVATTEEPAEPEGTTEPQEQTALAQRRARLDQIIK